MNFLIAVVLKISLVFAIAWIVTIALRRSSAAMRHQIWAAAILCALLLPALTFLLPQWTPARPAVTQATSTTAAHTFVQVTAARPVSKNLRTSFEWAWAAGASIMLLRLIFGLAQLYWAGSRARPLFGEPSFRGAAQIGASLGMPSHARLLVSPDDIQMPLTWGIIRPKILLPASAANWPEERLRIVLAHELAHIARRDWILRIAAELACAAYWFHPLAWLAAMSLREESERACDDIVLSAGVKPADYADQLVGIARTFHRPARAWSAALAMLDFRGAHPSNFERRLIAMLNPTMNRRRPSAAARVYIALAAIALLLPIAAVRAPGQALAGNFTGTVLDPTGAVVPGAIVTVTNNTVSPSTRDTAVSDQAGRFSFASLPAGQYEVRTAAKGFDGMTAKQVTLEPGRDATMNINLAIGRIMEQVTVSAPGTPRVAPPMTLQRIRVGGMVQAASLIQKVAPVYPPHAQAAGIEGTVELIAVIGKDGSVLSLQVQSRGVDPDLAAAAKEAVSQWRYQPTKLNGEPVEVITQISVQFSLHE
jgi:TonB family protein